MKKIALATAVTLALGVSVAMASPHGNTNVTVDPALAVGDAAGATTGGTAVNDSGNKSTSHSYNATTKDSYNSTDVDIRKSFWIDASKHVNVNKQESSVNASMEGATTGTKVEGGGAKAEPTAGALSGSGAKADADADGFGLGWKNKANDHALAVAGSASSASARNGETNAAANTVVGSGNNSMGGGTINGIGAIAQSTGYSSLIQQQNNVSINAQVGGH
jgi:hypothetical protein